MTDPKPEDLDPVSDDDFVFEARMILGRDSHGRMKAPPKVCQPWESIGRNLAEGFRKRGLYVFKRRPTEKQLMGHSTIPNWSPRTKDK